MASSTFPTTDAGWLSFGLNFSTLITATPLAFGLTAGQATSYSDLFLGYSNALALAVDPGTKTKATVASKNSALALLKNSTRLLAKLVEGTASVTNAQKISLGLNVRATPTPQPAPTVAPNLDVVSVLGRTLQVKLHDGTGTRRGKPVGVDGASLFSFTGATPPADISSWKFEGNTSRTTVNVTFDSSLAPGATVWLSAFWFNERKQAGPVSTPVSTTFGSAGVSMAA